MSIGSLLRTIVIIAALLVTGLVLGLKAFILNDRSIDYPTSTDDLLVPRFTQQVIDFIPEYDSASNLPFTAGAIIDIDNDGVEELFIGGGSNQQDGMFRYTESGFVNITRQVHWSKNTPDNTLSAIALDLDKDGDTDMLVSRESGVYLYDNSDGVFTMSQLELDLDPQTVPLSVAVADLNRDGLYDIYVSGYIKREFARSSAIFNEEYGGVSSLYLNTGDNGFRNITVEAGLSYKHNTFQSMFIDVDNDGLEDLVVAHDTGQVMTWKNLGNLTFQNLPNPTSDNFSYPMGIAVTDLGNDGLPDFFFSNVGSTVPVPLLRGDLQSSQILNPKWMLLENQGNFQFIDMAVSAQLADYETSRGAVFEDFNLDGRDDLVVSQNNADFLLHRVANWRLDGRFLLQKETGEFVETASQSGVKNREFSISPLTADFNQDGYPDLVHVNLQGPQNVFLSEGGSQGFLKVSLPNTVESIGAQVSVTLDDGSTLVRTFVIGEGLCSDQSHVLIFGLGEQRTAVEVVVKRLDGSVTWMDGQYRNETIAL